MKKDMGLLAGSMSMMVLSLAGIAATFAAMYIVKFSYFWAGLLVFLILVDMVALYLRDRRDRKKFYLIMREQPRENEEAEVTSSVVH